MGTAPSGRGRETARRSECAELKKAYSCKRVAEALEAEWSVAPSKLRRSAQVGNRLAYTSLVVRKNGLGETSASRECCAHAAWCVWC